MCHKSPIVLGRNIDIVKLIVARQRTSLVPDSVVFVCSYSCVVCLIAEHVSDTWPWSVEAPSCSRVRVGVRGRIGMPVLSVTGACLRGGISFTLTTHNRCFRRCHRFVDHSAVPILSALGDDVSTTFRHNVYRKLMVCRPPASWLWLLVRPSYFTPSFHSSPLP